MWYSATQNKFSLFLTFVYCLTHLILAQPDDYSKYHPATLNLSQDGQILTLDDMQLQIFNELWGKL